MNLDLTPAEQEIWGCFHSERYTHLNDLRWRLLVQTGIPLAGKIIFEPGAGIGDQTEWLLAQGVAHVIVNDGREGNLAIIRKRFAGDARVTFKLGNIENCLDWPEFQFSADLVYLWGVYYHLDDPLTEFSILRKLSRIAPVVVFDYLESAEANDWVETYNYETPSTSISRRSGRPTRETMAAGLKQSFGHAYFPREQMNWQDPFASRTPRRLAVGSRAPLDWTGLVEA